MTKEQAIEVLHELDGSLYETQQVSLDMAIKALEQPNMDKAMICILTKENDDLKVEIGRLRQALENPTSDDCVSRQAVLEHIDEWWNCGTEKIYDLRIRIREMRSVSPTHGTCKDCKHINCEHHEETCDIDEYNPNFYCADFKKRGVENG